MVPSICIQRQSAACSMITRQLGSVSRPTVPDAHGAGAVLCSFMHWWCHFAGMRGPSADAVHSVLLSKAGAPCTTCHVSALGCISSTTAQSCETGCRAVLRVSPGVGAQPRHTEKVVSMASMFACAPPARSQLACCARTS